MKGNVPHTTQLMHVSVCDHQQQSVSVCLIERIDGVFNVSVSTINDFQRRGYASRCVEDAVRWWANSPHVKKHDLNWWARSDNQPSIKLACRNGFTHAEDNDGWSHFVLTANSWTRDKQGDLTDCAYDALTIIECESCKKTRDRVVRFEYALHDQAIEAWNTRAERTCKWTQWDQHSDEYFSTECGREFQWATPYDLPNHCPGCGAKVVE